MSDKPKVLIFAPREEPPETIKAIEGLGCELVIGNRDWQLPRTHYEDDVVAQARDCVALMGTSMRHTPISRRVMEASQRLRIVAKYTVGVDDIDTDAATDLGIMVCHAPTESNCFGVAETTVAMMLSLLKKLDRPRRRRARRQMAHRRQFFLLRRRTRVGRLPRPDHRLRRLRPHREPRRATADAVALRA